MISFHSRSSKYLLNASLTSSLLVLPSFFMSIFESISGGRETVMVTVDLAMFYPFVT